MDPAREPGRRHGTAGRAPPGLAAAMAAALAMGAPGLGAAGGATREFGSPDGALRAVVTSSGAGRESRVAIVAKGRRLAQRSFASADGSHGYVVAHAAWTPDSQFFVFSLTSSGGHQPWLFPTYAYSRRSNRLGSLEGRIGAPTDPDFRLSAPDVLSTQALGKGGASRQVRLRLGGTAGAPR